MDLVFNGEMCRLTHEHICNSVQLQSMKENGWNVYNMPGHTVRNFKHALEWLIVLSGDKRLCVNIDVIYIYIWLQPCKSKLEEMVLPFVEHITENFNINEQLDPKEVIASLQPLLTQDIE